LDLKRYALISPCRNEGKFLAKTVDSVLAQSILPAVWVIVDDGSTDNSPEILAEYAKNHSFIKVISRVDRGERKVGPGVIDAFYEGLESIDINDYDYLCKLDTDLILPKAYFEGLMTKMHENPRIGACSGKPYYVHPLSGSMVSEFCGDEAAVGASKFYRTSSFKEMGGFVREVFWDAIDGHKLRMLGWIAISWDDLDLRFTHLRPMGSSQKGILTGRVRHGFGSHFMGSSYIYVIAACINALLRRPVLLGSVAIWYGFIRSKVKALPQYDDLEFRAFLRAYQFDCLRRGKAEATRRLDEKQQVIWGRRRN